MSNKQKHKSFENRQNQAQQKMDRSQNLRQEIPDYGTKSQNQKPEMDKDHHSGRC